MTVVHGRPWASKGQTFSHNAHVYIEQILVNLCKLALSSARVNRYHIFYGELAQNVQRGVQKALLFFIIKCPLMVIV